MNKFTYLFAYLIEFNIILLIFSFLFIHVGMSGWFNDFWWSLLVLWILSKLLMNDKKTIPRPLSIKLIFALFYGIVLSVIFSENINESLITIKPFIKGVGLCFVIYDFVYQDEKRLQRLISYFIIGAVLVSIDAIMLGVMITELRGGALADGRAQAFFSHPFYLSLWTGIGLLSALFKMLDAKEKMPRIFYYLCILVMGSAFLLSKTRAVWLAFISILLIISFFIPGKKNFWRFVIPFSIIAVAVLFFEDSLRSRVLSIIHESNPRWIIWKHSMDIVQEKFSTMDFFTGRGPGLFNIEYTQYKAAKGIRHFPELFPHNIFLELFYASGLIGVGSFTVWFSAYIYRLFLAMGGSRLIVPAVLSLFVFLACFINESFFSRYFSFTFWFFTGLSLSLISKQNR